MFVPKSQLPVPTAEYLAEDKSHHTLNAGIGFIVVTTVVFGIFLISKFRFRAKTSHAVWILITLSYLGCIGQCILGILNVRIAGGGRHVEYHRSHDPTKILRWFEITKATEFVYNYAITFPKLAILAFYLEVFTGRKTRIATWAAIALVTTIWIISVILALSMCRPFAFGWDKSIAGGTCGDVMAFYRWWSVPSIVSDLAILIIPWTALQDLRTISAGRKFGVFLTFLTGSMGLITAIIRMAFFFETDLLKDPTFLSSNTMTATVIEPSAYFICACLPHLRPLLREAFERTGLRSMTSPGHQTRITGGESSVSLWDHPRRQDSGALTLVESQENFDLLELQAARKNSRGDNFHYV